VSTSYDREYSIRAKLIHACKDLGATLDHPTTITGSHPRCAMSSGRGPATANRQFRMRFFRTALENGDQTTQRNIFGRNGASEFPNLRGHRPSGHKDNRLSQPSLQIVQVNAIALSENLSIVMNIQVYYVHEIFSE